MPLREEAEEVHGSDGVSMARKELGELGSGEGRDEGGEVGVGLPAGIGEDLVELGDGGGRLRGCEIGDEPTVAMRNRFDFEEREGGFRKHWRRRLMEEVEVEEEG